MRNKLFVRGYTFPDSFGQLGIQIFGQKRSEFFEGIHPALKKTFAFRVQAYFISGIF